MTFAQARAAGFLPPYRPALQPSTTTGATDLLERINAAERERDAAHGRAEHLDGEAARLRWVVEQQVEQLQRHGDLISRLRDLSEAADRAWAQHDTEHADVQPEWHITTNAGAEPAGDSGSPSRAQGDRQAAAVEALSRALKACGCWLPDDARVVTVDVILEALDGLPPEPLVAQMSREIGRLTSRALAAEADRDEARARLLGDFRPGDRP